MRRTALFVIAGVILIAILLIIIRLQLTHLKEEPQFSATVTGEFVQTLSADMQNDFAGLATVSRVLFGKFQVLGFTSQSKKVMIVLAYPSSKMPPEGTYAIQAPSGEVGFLGMVMDFSRIDVDNVTSISRALEITGDIRRYTSTEGSITFEETDGIYKGQFNFTASRDISETPIRVVGTFANIRYKTTE